MSMNVGAAQEVAAAGLALDSNILDPSEYDDKCSITLDTFKSLAEEDNIAKTPCKHKFSHTAIFDWVMKNKKCPMCIAPLELNALVAMQITEQVINNARVLPLNIEEDRDGESEGSFAIRHIYLSNSGISSPEHKQ